MSLFNQMIRGDSSPCAEAPSAKSLVQRTFKENLADQIAFHKRKISELEGVYTSLTPDLEKFVEALQKLG